MRLSRLSWFYFGVGLLLALGGAGCGGNADTSSQNDGRLTVVATTSLVADLVSQIGGDHVDVTGLMGPGVDPHLYKASEGDVSRMFEADIIFYNGLHLEGKMTEVFEQMEQRTIRTHAVADAVEESDLLGSEEFTGNYDPHIWLDVTLWRLAGSYVAERLAEADPEHAATYRAHAARTDSTLRVLSDELAEMVAVVPDSNRILITSHDAFGYFGRSYGFEVRGLQGLSTALEAGTADVKELVDYIVANNVPAIFVESSISRRGIDAVRAAAQDRGHDVLIGGTLYGDALGAPGTPEGTFAGMYRHNMRTITEALVPTTASAL